MRGSEARGLHLTGDVRELQPRERRRRAGLAAQVPVMLPGTLCHDDLPDGGLAVRLTRALEPEAVAAPGERAVIPAPPARA